MADRAGYDQPGDGYTDKNAKFGVQVVPEVPPPQQGCTCTCNNHSYQMQPTCGETTNTSVVENQPSSGTVIVRKRHRDYMIPSVIVCLCCFWPLGIAAMHYANLANISADEGNYEKARRMSTWALKYMISGVIAGILVIATVVVMYNFKKLF